MDLNQEITKLRDIVDEKLKDIFSIQKARAKEISDISFDLVNNVEEFTLRGGKRLRPALIYYSYKLFDQRYSDDEIIKISVYIELIHSYFLIHDDIMDRAKLRRGGKTINTIYEETSSNSGFNDDNHFGISMAILAGDLLNSFWLEIITETSINESKKSLIFNITSKEICNAIFGETHDLFLNYSDTYCKQDILNIHLLKTAGYTFKLPLKIGSILGDASEEDQKVLEEYAISCGLAFQIRDDILGVFGKDENTGKSSLSDLREGKKTLLVAEAYRNASVEQRNTLDKYIGKKDLSESEANIVKDIFQSTGSLDYSKNECQNHIEQAKIAIAKLKKGKDKKAHEFLLNLANYLVIRDI